MIHKNFFILCFLSQILLNLSWISALNIFLSQNTDGYRLTLMHNCLSKPSVLEMFTSLHQHQTTSDQDILKEDLAGPEN